MSFVPIFFGCNREDPVAEKNITVTSAYFSGCITETKSAIPDIPSVRLSAQNGDMLAVEWSNSEFCCGTDSISISSTVSGNDIIAEVIDLGPLTWCYCPHDLSFSIGPFNKENYNLTFIESEHAYSRDTFSVSINYSPQIDTTILRTNTSNLIGNNPVIYAKTEEGGCNDFSLKSETNADWPESDTVIIYVLTDTLKIFVGLHLTCCIEFEPESYITGDTLVMRTQVVNDDFCDCICYYTFDYYFSEYTGQGFYYQFFVGETKWFEGSHLLP